MIWVYPYFWKHAYDSNEKKNVSSKFRLFVGPKGCRCSCQRSNYVALRLLAIHGTGISLVFQSYLLRFGVWIRYVFGVQIPSHQVFGSLGFGNKEHSCAMDKLVPVSISIWIKSLIIYPSSHNHGSVKNETILNP